jgi:hypothetical protein
MIQQQIDTTAGAIRVGDHVSLINGTDYHQEKVARVVSGTKNIQVWFARENETKFPNVTAPMDAPATVQRMVPDEMDKAKDTVRFAGWEVEHRGKDVVTDVRKLAANLRDLADGLDEALLLAGANFAILSAANEGDTLAVDGATPLSAERAAVLRTHAARDAIERFRRGAWHGFDRVLEFNAWREGGSEVARDLERWADAWDTSLKASVDFETAQSAILTLANKEQ